MSEPTVGTAPRLLRRQEVEYRTGLSRSALYRAIQEGRFPRPLRLSKQTTVWPETLVNEWINQQLANYHAWQR